MIKYFHSAVFFLFLVLLSNPANASSLAGGEILYRCTGNGIYEVTVKIYTDCNGTALVYSNLMVESTNGSQSFSVINQTKTGVRDVTGLAAHCLGSKCSGGSSPFGIEEHTWTMNVDLSSYSDCEWMLYWEQSERNVSITTGMGGENFFIHASLNKCIAPCNSSPYFTEPNVGQAVNICHNRDFMYSFAVSDTIDVGDSFSYALIGAVQGKGVPASYVSQYNAVRPMRFLGFPNNNLAWPGGFRLDPATGIMRFRPTEQNESGVIVVEVTEWREVNGVMTKAGTIIRDLQVNVVDCTNAIPSIPGSHSKFVTAGQKVCLSIVTNDADTDDTVRVSWDNSIPGAVFSHNNGTVKHASGEICWTPTQIHIRKEPYVFYVKATDNSCDLPGVKYAQYSIYVGGIPTADMHINRLGCGRLALDYTETSDRQISDKEWRITDTMNNVIWFTTEKTETILLQPGKYYIRLGISNAQAVLNSYKDTVVINQDSLPPIPTVTQHHDVLICNDLANYYQWYKNNQPIPGANAQSYLVVENGGYKVAAGNSAICNNISENTLVVPTNLKDVGQLNKLQVFPNPSEGLFNLSFELNSSQNLTFSVYDALGRSVFTTEKEFGQGINEYQLELKNLSSGIYQLIISDQHSATVHRNIVLK